MLLFVILFREALWPSQKFIYLLGIIFAGLKTNVGWGSERLGNLIKLIS
ncbi:hypothetical protein LINPERHAP2_LOCUS16020 [Linum perenne]